jgi:hypothetical protein
MTIKSGGQFMNLSNPFQKRLSWRATFKLRLFAEEALPLPLS